MKRKIASVVVPSCLVVVNWRVTAQQTPDWGSGVAPFAFALIGDMPYGAVREDRSRHDGAEHGDQHSSQHRSRSIGR